MQRGQVEQFQGARPEVGDQKGLAVGCEFQFSREAAGGDDLGMAGIVRVDHVDRLGLAAAETVWNDGTSGGATGGGVSDTFAQPSWQSSAGVPVRFL